MSNKLQADRIPFSFLSLPLSLSFVPFLPYVERKKRSFEQVLAIFSNRRRDAVLGIEIDVRDELKSSKDISTGVPYE